ncbi:MAG TPA: cytochrome P460 family protein [Terracidiphilus sp.]|nr:cytochrome P460 family protein [Terracidiphilus sp.]
MRSGLLCLGGLCLLAALIALPFSFRPMPAVKAAGASAPAYAANGDMLPIANYREWVYLSTGMDMNYNPKAMAMDHSMFDNVFVNPEAYRSFVATGTWPDKTVMALEVRKGQSKGSINQRGQFQGEEILGFEVHVKDEARFPGGWAFFDFDSPQKNGTLIPSGAPCYSCHLQHGAVNTTFVQFYPTLLPIARAKGTLSPEFVKEEASSGR